MEFKDNLLDIQDVKRSKLPLLDLFIRKTAVLTSTSESLVELIIKDQWDNANKQTQTNVPISEIDIPSIGVFGISNKKCKTAEKRIAIANEKLNRVILNSKSEAVKDKNREMIKNNNKVLGSIKIKNKKERLEKLKEVETNEN